MAGLCVETRTSQGMAKKDIRLPMVETASATSRLTTPIRNRGAAEPTGGAAATSAVAMSAAGVSAAAVAVVKLDLRPPPTFIPSAHVHTIGPCSVGPPSTGRYDAATDSVEVGCAPPVSGA